jgi:beta-lactamase class A
LKNLPGIFSACLPVAAALFLYPGVRGQTSESAALLEEQTLRKIAALSDATPGALGVYAIDLATGRTMAFHADTQFPTASSIKIAIMIEMFNAAAQGKFKMADNVTIQPSEAVGGSGHLQILLRKGPYTLTVKELITAMIETSDNTATNKCIAMAGMENVNRTLDGFGLRKTRLQRKMIDSASATAGRENISTPSEMARLIQLLFAGKAVNEAASKEMLTILKLVDADIRKVVPDRIDVAAKPGELTGVRCETAIVFLPRHPFAVSIMSTFLTPGANPVGDAARIVYDHFEKLDASNQYGNRVH